MIILRFLVSGLAALALLVGLPARADTPVTIFAAASLRGALEAVLGDAHPAPVTVSYGGSGTMARQVAQGAPADLVILASPDWMDWLETHAPLLPGSRRDLLSNTLVLVGPKGAAALPDPDAVALLAALGDGRLAMGQRDAVPAGSYARAWLTHIGAWDALQPHLAETDNVRAALALVALGEAPLGVVYDSDALAEPGVDVLWAIPGDQHPAILYPAAAITPRGAALLATLSSPGAATTFARFGFTAAGPAL